MRATVSSRWTQLARYVQGRRRGSLEDRVQLTLDEQPTAVRQPTHLVRRVSGEEFALSDQLGVDGVLTQLSESMLILGEPGAGKTTQLLDLAGVLVERARADAGSGLPVLLDLADWSRSAERGSGWFRRGEGGPRDFVEWLLGALDERYGIPEKTGRAWLADDRLTLLLDGLDEVREQDRDRCVDEINKLQAVGGVTGMRTLRSCTHSMGCDRSVIIGPLRHRRTCRGSTSVSRSSGAMGPPLNKASFPRFRLVLFGREIGVVVRAPLAAGDCAVGSVRVSSRLLGRDETAVVTRSRTRQSGQVGTNETRVSMICKPKITD
ncbi:MAG: hypothetical protein M3Z25_08910 [Actinomycetota bacterium]|nr:hypothetical protein [Actinomycetota bacterium]